jgi:hypothetical protein
MSAVALVRSISATSLRGASPSMGAEYTLAMIESQAGQRQDVVAEPIGN